MSRSALLAETLGTAGLLAVVVGSGIMADQLCAGNTAVALMANTLATGAGLFALILTFAPHSGAHFNPLVTLSLALRGQFPWRRVPGFALAQVLGAVLGVWLAHLCFDVPIWQISTQVRSSLGHTISEAVATCGLLLVIHQVSRHQASQTPLAVALWVCAGYWFTVSTCFANPAVTLARSLSDTFTGIAPSSLPGFFVGQATGLAVALLILQMLHPYETEHP